MNKNSMETTPLGVVIGLLIAVLLSAILIKLTFDFISDGKNPEEKVEHFYFAKLAEDLTKMSFGDIKNSNFLTNEDIILLSFNKDFNSIKKDDLDKNCLISSLSKDIEKPVLCRDKNCICLCKISSSSFSSGFEVNCDSEDSRCVEIPLKVDPIKSCQDFVFYDKNENLYGLEVKKNKDSFKINPSLSKTL